MNKSLERSLKDEMSTE